jgi:hypothetical protein
MTILLPDTLRVTRLISETEKAFGELAELQRFKPKPVQSRTFLRDARFFFFTKKRSFKNVPQDGANS